jgi:hypothetical protein
MMCTETRIFYRVHKKEDILFVIKYVEDSFIGFSHYSIEMKKYFYGPYWDCKWSFMVPTDLSSLLLQSFQLVHPQPYSPHLQKTPNHRKKSMVIFITIF